MKTIFFSFYTLDKYYIQHSERLAKNLDELGYEYNFQPIEIPEGLEWPDLCRKKIGLLYDFYISKPDYRVIWIDIDCRLKFIPEIVKKFSSDIIGFQRGFGVPKKIGYSYKSRFWEPCFLGFNRTEQAERFLRRAYELEQEYAGRATDDYFFEESWRECSNEMSYQFIPSCMAKLEGRTLSIDPAVQFFEFGSSGNVKEFAKKVDQHKVDWIPPSDTIKAKQYDLYTRAKFQIAKRIPAPVRLSIKRIISSEYQKLTLLQFKSKMLKYAKNGDGVGVQKVISSQLGMGYLTPQQKKIYGLANSFLYYRKDKARDSIKLAWWSNPEPGNFGDWLSPYILNKITGKNIEFVNPESKSVSSEHYFSVGSIGKFIKRNSIVLGTGCSTVGTEFNPEAEYVFVRGPLTRKFVLNSGGQCPEVYGDPAIVMPLLYTPKKSDKYAGQYILVRHFTHLPIDIELPSGMVEISIYQSHPKKIESFIDALKSSRGVVTSAMHCYIICQAYGIPCALVTFKGYEDAVHGDGLKYKDYHLGVGTSYRPLPVLELLDIETIKNILTNDQITDIKIREVYDVLCKELTDESS